MDKKIYYTILTDPNFDENWHNIELANEEDYELGFTASLSFNDATWDKIESAGLIELQEGIFESPIKDLEELKTCLNNHGFIYGSVEI